MFITISQDSNTSFHKTLEKFVQKLLDKKVAKIINLKSHVLYSKTALKVLINVCPSCFFKSYCLVCYAQKIQKLQDC